MCSFLSTVGTILGGVASIANAVSGLTGKKSSSSTTTTTTPVTGTVAESPTRSNDEEDTLDSERRTSNASRVGTRGLRTDLTIAGLNTGTSGAGLNI
ncbi:hypothetical protein NON00_02335 [Roseomonas sp. GC11]|uniref:hypothetical protein n=1 Tax=Roseomonas sp. GC11 TaxID=2950546 RepID=UPI00210964E7|nr:hypothetical protein [Roseomonas sp. GC11]MCQ4158765.1 hypothetical protein [Roseomonas sp. GC11]